MRLRDAEWLEWPDDWAGLMGWGGVRGGVSAVAARIGRGTDRAEQEPGEVFERSAWRPGGWPTDREWGGGL